MPRTRQSPDLDGYVNPFQREVPTYGEVPESPTWATPSSPDPTPTETKPSPYSGGWEGLEQFVSSVWGSQSPNIDWLYKYLKDAGINVTRPTRAGGALSDDKLEFGDWGWGVDFIRDVGGPNQEWAYFPYRPGQEESGGGGSVGGDVGSGTEFDDPWASRLEQFIQERMGGLQQDPARPDLQKLIDGLLQANTDKQRNAQAFADAMRGRVEELAKPAYSEGDDAVIRAKAFDQLERRRQETMKNRREELYARGHAPTSGTVTQAEQDSSQMFEQARTGIESDLLLDSIQENQRRKDKSVGLEQLIEQALSGADLQGLQYQSQIADIEDSLIGDRESRLDKILAMNMVPLDLMQQRQAMANQTLGLGGNPQSVMQSILAILNAGQQNRGLNLASSQNNMQGLGQLLEILFGGR